MLILALSALAATPCPEDDLRLAEARGSGARRGTYELGDAAFDEVGQLWDLGVPVTVEGAVIHAYGEAAPCLPARGDCREEENTFALDVIVWGVGEDGFPNGSALAVESFTFGCTCDVTSPANYRRTVRFTNPPTLDRFILTVARADGSPVKLLHNNPADDGQDDLARLRVQRGWSGGDADVWLFPSVTYDLDAAGVWLPGDDACFDSGETATLEAPLGPADVPLLNRADGPAHRWDWGDETFDVGDRTASHTFANGGPQHVSHRVELVGFGGSSCVATDTISSPLASTSWFPDCDGDGHPSPDGVTSCGSPAFDACPDGPGGGWTDAAGGDCRDQDVDAYPGAVEICDDVDQDCDGSADNDVPDLPSGDQDGACEGDALECAPGGVWVPAAGNHEPSDDVCNGVDDDCDPGTQDGHDDPLRGVDCDGADADPCAGGTWICQGGANVCSDDDDRDTCDDPTDTDDTDPSDDPAGCSCGHSGGPRWAFGLGLFLWRRRRSGDSGR